MPRTRQPCWRMALFAAARMTALSPDSPHHRSRSRLSSLLMRGILASEATEVPWYDEPFFFWFVFAHGGRDAAKANRSNLKPDARTQSTQAGWWARSKALERAVTLVNQRRGKLGLPSVGCAAAISGRAGPFQDMNKRGYMGEATPEGDPVSDRCGAPATKVALKSWSPTELSSPTA